MPSLYDQMDLLTASLLNLHDDDGLGDQAKKCIASLDWYATASHPSAVKLLIALLCTSMDSEISQAVGVVKKHNRDAWQECIGYVLTCHTLGYWHEQLKDEITTATVDYLGRIFPEGGVLPDSHRLDGYDHNWAEGEGGGCAVCDGVVPAGRKSESVSPAQYRHVFQCGGLSGTLFAHRSPQVWADDLLSVCGYFERGDWEIPESADEASDEWDLVVEGTENVLRFLCVALNQHAEQSPSDTTPVGEAVRLEETLRGPSLGDAPPPCPKCHARRWQVVADVTNQAAIMVRTESEVLVDRAEPADSTKLVDVGAVMCESCGWEPVHDVAAHLLRAEVIQRAAAALDDRERPWRVITTYTQF